MKRKEGPDSEQKIEPWKTQKQFRCSHERLFYDPPVVSGHHPERGTCGQRNDCRQNASRDGHLAAVEHSRKLIATKFVRAEESDLARLVHAKQVPVQRHKAEQFVLIPPYHEANQKALTAIFHIAARSRL